MKAALASVRDVRGSGDLQSAVQRLFDDWQRGVADLSLVWEGLGPGRPASELGVLIKADLRCRFARGERADVHDYLARFPDLRDEGERVLSLIYEEFCLLEELGERPEVETFCDKYPSWRDSLALQLRYHDVLSRVVGATETPRFPKPGERFQSFMLKAELGRGGSARVYLANDESLGGREVALKVYPDRGTEASILGRLDHRHIVPVHSTLDEPETKLRGLCMPYRAGLTLDEVIRRVAPGSRPRSARALWAALTGRPDSVAGALAAPLPVGARPEGPGWASFPTRGSYADAVAWVGATVAGALAHAHSRDVQHRDVKPANILLTYAEGPQLLDFNLAHDRHSPEQADAALRGGTLPYMAPEQLRAFLDPARWEAVDERADLYSLGLVLRELLTGEAPDLPDPSLPRPRMIADMLDRRLTLRPDPRRANPRLSRALGLIVTRCLAADPSERYQSAADLAEDLRRYLARLPLKHVANPDRRERVSNWARRHFTTLATSFALLGVGGSAVFAVNSDRWLHEITERRPFHEAVRLFDDGRPAEAIPPLRALAAEATPPPVLRIYLAMADARTKNVTNALERLGWVWDDPRAFDDLVAWGARHPAFVGQTAEFAQFVLKSGVDEARKPSPADIKHAFQTLELAVRLNPDDTLDRVGLATLEERNGRYAEAWARVSDVIDGSAAEPDSSRGRTALRKAYDVRARLGGHWADALLKDPARGAPEVGRAGDLFNGALADLERTRRLTEPPINDAQRYRIAYIGAEVSLGLARVDLLRSRKDDAVRNLRGALERLEPFRSEFEESDKLYQRVSQTLRQVEPG